jgi:putative zinc finger/helix-turn-helix YgiT family protein
MNTCWECGKEMQEKELQFTGKVKGEEFTLETPGIVCECGYRNVGAHQMDEYNIKLADAYRKAHNLLTSKQIKKCRKRLGMSQQEFADFLKVHVQSIKRWEHGCVQEESMDELIRFKIKKMFPDENIPAKTEIPEKILKKLRVTIVEVADYILRVFHHYEEHVTHLKLQKLLYFSQAWFLAFYGRPLFEEDFIAWEYGPVARSIYDRFKHFGREPITEEVVSSKLPESIMQHIYYVLRIYGGHTAFKLAQITHDEKPWKDARGDLPEDAHSDVIITKESIKGYYQSIIEMTGY